MCRLTNDFHVNKRIIDNIAVIQTKRLRNKIAGFTTHLMKRILKGPVRGISLRLQEEVSVALLINFRGVVVSSQSLIFLL